MGHMLQGCAPPVLESGSGLSFASVPGLWGTAWPGHHEAFGNKAPILYLWDLANILELS